MNPIPSVLETRTLAALLLVGMLVLAGCTGSDLPADGSPGAGDGQTSAPGDGGGGDGSGDGTGDGSSDGDAGDGDAGDADSGGGDSGSGDGSGGGDGSMGFDAATWDSYSGNLQSIESYTVTYTFSSSGADSGAGEGVVKVDGEQVSQRFSFSGDGDAVVFEYYRPADGDTVYSKFGASGSTFYRSYPASDAPINTYADPLRDDTQVATGQQGGGQQVDSSVGAVPEFRDEGVVQTDDGPRHKYVIDDVSQLPPETLENTNGEVTDIYLELLVDEDRGLPTNYVYRMTVDPSGSAGPMTSEFTLTYSDFGSTTVEEPDWLDQAKTSGSSGYGSGYGG